MFVNSAQAHHCSYHSALLDSITCMLNGIQLQSMFTSIWSLLQVDTVCTKYLYITCTNIWCRTILAGTHHFECAVDQSLVVCLEISSDQLQHIQSKMAPCQMVHSAFVYMRALRSRWTVTGKFKFAAAAMDTQETLALKVHATAHAWC